MVALARIDSRYKFEAVPLLFTRLWLEGTLKCGMLESTVDGRLQMHAIAPRVGFGVQATLGDPSGLFEHN